MEKIINYLSPSQKKIIGYILLALSCATWLLMPFIGLFNLSTGHSAILLTTLIVLGEVCFVLSIVFLGKEVWQKIKYFFVLWWNKIRNFNKH